MGDVLHTLPALTDTAAAIPGVQFDWVVEENFSQIPSWHSAVNRIIPVAIRCWRTNWFGAKERKERHQFYLTLCEKEYDVIIDAQGLLKSAFIIARKARGMKHGYDIKSVREKMACWFYDVKHAVDKNQHAIERTRQLFSLSLNYEYGGIGDYGIATHFSLSGDNNYFVFLHATTRANKHWLEDYWRAVIVEVAKYGLQVKLPWGTQAEFESALRLAKGLAHAEVLPKLSLTDMATILAGSRGAVSVDTGLSHLTAALGKPNIVLYGPTNPELVGGYGCQQFVLKSPNNQMASIMPSDVITSLKTHHLL